MPFGLPGLSPRPSTACITPLAGSRVRPTKAPAAPTAAGAAARPRSGSASVTATPSRKGSSARYVYEHLFLAHLHFDADRRRRIFGWCDRLRRPAPASTKIATRRPFDDPAWPRLYYRLVPAREAHRRQDALALSARARRACALARAVSRRPIIRSIACPLQPEIARQPVRDFRRRCRCARDIASCSTRPSSRSWASSRARCAAASWRSTSSTTTSGVSSRSSARLRCAAAALTPV